MRERAFPVCERARVSVQRQCALALKSTSVKKTRCCTSGEETICRQSRKKVLNSGT